jgi:glycosyltransferase involved in cell wall biosynthesis
LIDAVKGLRIKLKIIGEGPMKADLETMVMNKKINNVDFLGYREGDALKDEIRKSQFIVLPSEWYENNPRSLIEGFALGKPALCARIGGISELVQDDKTGLTFESGNSDDLRDKISKLVSNASQLEHMGRNARKMAEEEFNPEIHYQRLMEIYKQAIHHNWQ